LAELFTRAECEKHFREEVAAAGGAKKWLRKNHVIGMDHVHHMIDGGTYFDNPQVLQALGLKRVERWEAVEAGVAGGEK
jgi:patatin-like phospholipase/acyl hydrolase